MTLSDHDYELYADRAYIAGKNHAGTHTFRHDNLLAGEWTDVPSCDDLISSLELDPVNLDRDDYEGLLAEFEHGYTAYWEDGSE